MKVLHINCNYLDTTLHQCMVEHLDRLGVDNTVFVPTYGAKNHVISPNDNVTVCRCFRKWDRLCFFYKQRKIQKALEQNLSVGTFDIIHACTLFTDGNCAYKMSKKYGIDYVVAIRSTDVNSFFKCRPHLIGRGVEIMKNAKYILFLSESYKQYVIQKYVPAKYRKAFEEKSCIVPNGIDDFWLQNLQKHNNTIANEPIKLVYAGRIDENKNVATTQAAMQILREKGYKVSLTVVGRVEDEDVFKQICQDRFTTCLPPVDKTELIHIYRGHHIFVMPSFKESFGLVYAEAISQGLPVVYSIGQGFDKQFGEGEVGYHADATSAQSVAAAISSIIQNYDKITPGLAIKAQCYDWNAICRRYVKIYQSIIEFVIRR